MANLLTHDDEHVTVFATAYPQFAANLWNPTAFNRHNSMKMTDWLYDPHAIADNRTLGQMGQPAAGSVVYRPRSGFSPQAGRRAILAAPITKVTAMATGATRSTGGERVTASATNASGTSAARVTPVAVAAVSTVTKPCRTSSPR